MIKIILNACNYSLFAEISLLMFFGIFIAVSVRTLFSDRRTMTSNANIVLEDQMEHSANEQ
jgi:hypothetical protein